MVSSGKTLRAFRGKKRKLQVEDSLKPVEEGDGSKEIQVGEDVEQMAQNVELVDRISQLPDHVIYHILSLLRNVKDAIRTRSFSKRWRTLWFSYAVLIFDEQKFAAGIGPEDGSNKENMFRQHVADSLHTYLANNSQIQKFLLHMTSFDLTNAPLVDNWLTSAVSQDIKEIDLQIGFKDIKRYTVPEVVLSSETLTGLRLSGCILKRCGNIKLPRLQKLYLRKIHLVEQIVTNLISCCPSIEDLRFVQCSGLKILFIYHERLCRVEIHNCNQLKKVDIFAPSLHTFWFCGKKSTPCKVNLEDCTSLKKLTLEHPRVTRDFCENQFSKFPLLEKLDLCISDKMKSIKIFNRCLQRIALKGCKKLTYAQIYAPKLVSFELKGETIPYFDIGTPFCLTDAKISIASTTERRDVGDGLGNKLWFMMKPFISMFSPPERFKMIIHSSKHIIIHEDLSSINYPPLHDLTFEIIKSSASVEDILYGLLRTLHPESVSIISSSGNKFHESVYEMIKIKDEDPVCCRYNTLKNKCWRHFLKDVKFESGEEMLDVGDASSLYSWLQLSYPLTSPHQMTNIRLSWNSHEPDVEK